MRVRGLLVAAALASPFTVPIGACATSHPVVASGPAAAPRDSADSTAGDNDAVLRVENHNWADVLVYVLHDGVKSRFLEVTATKSIERPIPMTLLPSTGTIQLLVHRIGGHDDAVSVTGQDLNANELTRDDYLSPRVSVRTGNVVTLTLESSLKRSTVGVW